MTGGARTNTLNFAVDVLTRVIDAERRPQPGSSQSERLAAVECRWGVRHVEGVDLSVSEESSSGVRFRETLHSCANPRAGRGDYRPAGHSSCARVGAGRSCAWPPVWRRARTLSAVDYLQVERFRRHVMQQMRELFNSVDLLFGSAVELLGGR